MTSSSSKLEQARLDAHKRKVKIMGLISVVAFSGFVVYGVVQSLHNLLKEATTDPAAETSTLGIQEAGLVKVLAKEPNNQFVLEQLINIRLAQGKRKEALALLERLVKLNPQRVTFQRALAQLRQDLASPQPDPQ